MKRFFCLSLLLILMLGGINAQEPRPAYCDLMAFNAFGGSKVYITIDLGQEHTGTICCSQNKPVKFNSYIDALNYMATLGWKVKDTYFLPETKQQVLHFLLEKTVATDAQIREGIYVKPPKEKVPYKPGQTGDDMY